MTATRGTDGAQRLVPVWLDNLAALSWRVLVIVIFAIVLAYLGGLIWNVLAAIGLAVVVAVIMAPLVLRLRAGGRSRAAAAGIAWLVAIAAVLGLFAILVLALLPYLGDLLTRVQGGQASLASVVADQDLPAWLNDLLAQLVGAADELGSSALESIVGTIANLVGILVIGTFLLFFFLKDGDKAWLWLFQSLDAGKRDLVTSTGDEALTRVGDYVRATTITAALGAVTSLLFMVVLGTPLALPLAILAFVLGYVPYFGGVSASLLIILITLGGVDSTAAVIMAGLMLVRYGLYRALVAPRVYGSVQMPHPVLILIALPIGLHFGGLIGLILAVPLAAVGSSVVQAVVDILSPDEPSNLPEVVPGWLDRAAQWSWRATVALVFAGMLVLVLTTIPMVLLPLILALILAATILPLVNYFLRRGQSRGVASALAVGGSTVAIVGVLSLAMISIVQQADDVAGAAADGADAVNEAAGGHLGLGADAVEAVSATGASVIAGLGGELVGLVLVVILAVLLTFYFLRDGARLWDGLMSHLPKDIVAELSAAGGRAFGVLGGYMVGTGAISLVGAASQAVIMWVLGLPLVLPIFVLSVFGGFIPYIGSALTTLLALLVAIAVGTPLDILIMVIWTLVFNIVQGNVVAPMVYNRTTDIHPAIVLAAIPAGAAVAGMLGMFLVVPVLGVVGTTWRSVLRVMGAGDDEIPGPRVEATDETTPEVDVEGEGLAPDTA